MLPAPVLTDMDFTWKGVTERDLSSGQNRLEVIEYSAEPMEAALSGYHQTLSRPARWRQLAVHVAGDGSAGNAVLETGALQYLRGTLEMQAVNAAGGSGLGGFLRGAVTAAASGEGLYKTAFRGSGTLYTEPTRLHLLLGELRGESLIVDDGAFVAWRCERTSPARAALQLCEMGDCEGTPPLPPPRHDARRDGLSA